ncbi:NOL1/NOP2/sun family putative RNA methylase [Candidatus Pacearchaeota archaeon]|nr:NOL1/NOP2/sun family putative RNA methylase [Candidatus Pacearchaeota archaeon]
MKDLLNNEKDYELFCEYCNKPTINSIRCNTLKMSVKELKTRLEKKWKILQPFKEEYPEIMIVESSLLPGELGKAEEHVLGYYYIQEISSMMPILALNPDENDIFLDIAAAPGSKTTQAAARMNNKGTIIANDLQLSRIVSLSTNLQRCGVTNTIITQMDGRELCKKLNNLNPKFSFDKILVDAPCSGEGTIRSSPRTALNFSENIIKSLGGIQKSLLTKSLQVLKINGELVYSTCTHSPEENEAIISHVLETYHESIKLEDIKLPKSFKTRQGITEWKNTKFHKDVKKCARIYPQDNDTEGFFIAKLKKVGEIN